jgi:hypothetical protein
LRAGAEALYSPGAVLTPLTYLPLLAQLPGMDPGPEKPASSVAPGYLELLERNSHLVYPALGGLVVVLVAFAILQALKEQDLHGAAKTEYKRLIVEELRRHPGGLEATELSEALGLESGKLVRLLDQMQQDGVLVSHTNTHRTTLWRVKGVGVNVAKTS